MKDSFWLYVSEATTEINKVAHHINENIRQRENFQKMLSIQNSLTGEGAPKILAPGNNGISAKSMMWCELIATEI